MEKSILPVPKVQALKEAGIIEAGILHQKTNPRINVEKLMNGVRKNQKVQVAVITLLM